AALFLLSPASRTYVESPSRFPSQFLSLPSRRIAVRCSAECPCGVRGREEIRMRVASVRKMFNLSSKRLWLPAAVAAVLFVGFIGLVRAQTTSIAVYQFGPGWATFGLALPPGAVPDTFGVSVGGFPTQTDIKTKWPDKSIRYAV